MIPDFNDYGDLPPGVHRVSLDEGIQYFGRSTPRRELIAMRLQRIYGMAHRTGHLRRFAVFGSFVTRKPEPNDVDIFMIMDDDFDVAKVNSPDAILFDHPSAQSHLGASVFWLRACAALGGEQAAIEDWMLTREGRQRGILEIQEQEMIKNDTELKVTRGRIERLELQISEIRKTETNPDNYRTSVSGFVSEIDRLQLEVREYLMSVPEPARAS